MQKLALIVDDSRVAQMTLSKLLISHSFEVIKVGSGEEAISHLQMAAVKPDIIFMDVMMGGMDGLTATRQIKADGSLNSIPVVICTGNDSETDRDSALSTGAIAVLSKPPSLEELTAILAKLEREAPVEIQPSEPEPIPAPAPAPAPAPSVIDDAELATKVLANIEQTIQDMVAKLVTEQVASQVNDLATGINEQAITQSKQAAEALTKQVAIQTAQQAVQSSIAEIDLSAQVSQTLSSEGVAWLNNQRQQIHAQLSEQLKQTITSSINQHLEAELASLVTPLVSEQINQHLAQQMNESEQAIEKLSKKVSQLKTMLFAIGVVVVAMAVVMATSVFNLV